MSGGGDWRNDPLEHTGIVRGAFPPKREAADAEAAPGPALRWLVDDADGTPVLSGLSGVETVAHVWHRPDATGAAWAWFVLDGGTLGEGGDALDEDAAKAAAQNAWAAWCERAGLVARGAAPPDVDAPDVPDPLAPDAAALVAAAAPVIRGMIADHLGEATGRETSERMAAAALAPALRELARQARADDGRDTTGVGGWLDGLADALDAGGDT